MKHRTTTRLAATIACCSLVVAACGSEDEPAASDPPAGGESESTEQGSDDTGGDASTSEPAADDESADGELVGLTVGATSPSFSYGMPLAMVANDIDAEHGLDIDYNPVGSSSTNVIAGVMSGEYDIGFQAASTALDAIAQGSDLIILAGGLTNASVLVVSPALLEEAGITADAPVEERIAALKGATLASSPDGSGNNSALRRIVSEFGLDPDKDLNIVGVTEPAAIVAGIKAGKFDGGYYGSGVLEANVVGGSGVMLLRSSDVPIFEGYLGLAATTTKKFADENPEVIEQFYAALSETATEMQARPAEIGVALREQYFDALSQEIFDVSWENALPAYPEVPEYSRLGFDTLVSIQTASTENDYSSLAYEEVVHPVGQSS